MGYDWIFRIAIAKGPIVTSKEEENEYVQLLYKAYQNLLLEDNEHILPRFGEYNHGISPYAFGIGYESDTEFKLFNLLFKFSTQFPDLKFHIYHIYRNYSRLTVYSLNNESCKRVFDEKYEQIRVEEGYFGINLKNIYINKEITTILSSGYLDDNVQFCHIVKSKLDVNNPINYGRVYEVLANEWNRCKSIPYTPSIEEFTTDMFNRDITQQGPYFRNSNEYEQIMSNYLNGDMSNIIREGNLIYLKDKN